MTYVYFIQRGRGAIKIGVSDDPETRLKTLQTGNQDPLKLIAKFPFKERKHAIQLEKDLHKKFEHEWIKGEWFHRRILKQFKNRSKLFPHIFNGHRTGKFWDNNELKK